MRIPALAFALASLALGVLILYPSAYKSAEAGGSPADAISIDMDVTGNSANALGERQFCTEANPGDQVTLDMTIEGVPPFVDNAPIGVVGVEDEDGISSFYGFLNFDSNVISVVGADITDSILSVNANSSAFNGSDGVPDFSSPWTASVLDTGSGIPESGDGILTRITVAVDAGAPNGGYQLTLTEAVHGTQDGFFTPAAVNNAAIAVGIACEDIPPPAEFIKGDNQCDGDVDAVDGLQGLRFVAGLAPVQDAGCPAIGSADGSIFGDMDCDNDTDAVDTLKILQFVAAIPVSLPAGCPPIGI